MAIQLHRVEESVVEPTRYDSEPHSLHCNLFTVPTAEGGGPDLESSRAGVHTHDVGASQWKVPVAHRQQLAPSQSGRFPFQLSSSPCGSAHPARLVSAHKHVLNSARSLDFFFQQRSAHKTGTFGRQQESPPAVNTTVLISLIHSHSCCLFRASDRKISTYGSIAELL